MTVNVPGARRAVFIVRLDQDPTGRVTGVVERVRTGEKERFAAVQEVGPILAEMLAREELERRSEQTTTRRAGR